MKLLKKSILFFILILILSFVSFSSISFAAENTSAYLKKDTDINIDDVKSTSPSCILIDAKTGDILYAKDAYQKMYPASTTKLMTAILTLENCKLNDVATVSHNAIFSIPVGYSHANLKEGEELTIEQLLNVLLIPSANDAAVVLAEHIAGSVDDFAVMMNNKAKEIGCLNTNFVNPNGIHHKNHYSTAYDLSMIGKYAMQFSDIMRIATVRQYTLPVTNKYNKTDRIFNATNALINNESLNKYYYPYATGLKTGYTDSSGSCIVATAKKGEQELLCVILKGSSINSRYIDCKTLFDYGFGQYSYTVLKEKNDLVKELEIDNATKETKNLKILVKDDISILLKKNIDISSLNPRIEIKTDLQAPIAENEVVGKITYTVNQKDYTSDLVASSNVYPSNLEVIVFRVLLIFLILYILYRLLRITNKPKKQKSKKKKNVQKKKKSKKTKRRNQSFEKGNFKYTQINDYL